MKLSPRQRDVLAFIERYVADRGYPPTIKEIGAALSISSTNGVADHLRQLARKGYVTWEKGKSRTLRVLKKAPLITEKDLGAGERLFEAEKTPVQNLPAHLSRPGGT